MKWLFILDRWCRGNMTSSNLVVVGSIPTRSVFCQKGGLKQS